MATVAGALVVIVAPAAAVYGAPDLVGLLAILALSMPIGALASVPGMIMRARLQFSVVAIYGTLEIVVQALLTVWFAWSGFGAYSFVLPMPILAAVKAVIWWRLAAPQTSLHSQFRRWR